MNPTDVSVDRWTPPFPDALDIVPALFTATAPWVAVALYLATVALAQHLVRRHPRLLATPTIARLLTGITVAHNALVGLESAILAVGLWSALATLTAAHDGYRPVYCGATAAIRDRLFFWLRWYLVTRYHELFDTLLTSIRGRPATALALVHHSVMVVCGWPLVRDGFAPTAAAAALNTIVHVIMYGYFAVTAVRRDALRWVRKWITTMQIGQFVIILAHYLPWARIVATEGDGSCSGSWAAFWNSMFPVTIILALFVNFFVKSYSSGNRSSTTAKGDKNE